jgi:hypothetical protein
MSKIIDESLGRYANDSIDPCHSAFFPINLSSVVDGRKRDASTSHPDRKKDVPETF